MITSTTAWNTYLERELPQMTTVLTAHGITLHEHQPHIQGERFLMQALTTTSGQKIILLGTQTSTGKIVVIKASSDISGKQELSHERACRTLLHKVNFSYDTFHSPTEVLFTETRGYLIYVTEFIEQTSSFLERPLPEQFSFALRALKAQEGTRATTARHIAQIKRVFGSRGSDDYLRMYQAFVINAQKKNIPGSDTTLLMDALNTLTAQKERIAQYSGFLTHTDFVPHNFRISGETLYLLDFSSLCFGNKHESWARFLNFMTLYNAELERLLIAYVENNRSREERESLQLMRIFRLGEIITYYSQTLEKSTGNLLELNQARVTFWTKVLRAELHNTRVAREIVTAYQTKRDELRSNDEKLRQIGLH